MNETAMYKQIFFLQNAIKGNLQVSVNMSRLGVVLPANLYDRPNGVLDIGLWLAKPVQGLDVNHEGIRVILTFGGAPFHCQLPWAAVWLIVVVGTDDGCVWIEDAPADMVRPATEPELPSTGTEGPTGPIGHPGPVDPTGSHKHRDAYIGELKPSVKKKTTLPAGWGVIEGGNNNQDDKEPA